MIIREFILPFPPSVNTAYGMSGGRRHKSAKVKNWEQKATSVLNAQCVLPVIERVIIEYSLDTPDARARDAANYEKYTTDFLVARGILQDDSARYIKGIYTYWNDTEGKTIKVIIKTI